MDRRAFLSLPAAAAALTPRDLVAQRLPSRRRPPSCAIRTRPCGRSTRASTSTASAPPSSNASTRDAAGPRDRCGSATCDACCGATSPTTACCAGPRRPARSASSASRANNCNGNTRDLQGRLVTCERRRVVRTEPNGAITVLVDSVDGQPLNSPNDVVAHPDGSLWFTDPGLRPAVAVRGRARGVQAADAGLSLGSGDQDGDADDRDDQAAERPVLLARLHEAVRGRHREPGARTAARHPRLRRRRRQEHSARAACSTTWARAAPTASGAMPTATSGRARGGPAPATTACG